VKNLSFQCDIPRIFPNHSTLSRPKVDAGAGLPDSEDDLRCGGSNRQGNRGETMAGKLLVGRYNQPYGYESKPWYLVNPKIAGKWMFIPLKMVLIGIDPYPYILEKRFGTMFGTNNINLIYKNGKCEERQDQPTNPKAVTYDTFAKKVLC